MTKSSSATTSRRTFLRQGFLGAGVLATSRLWGGCTGTDAAQPRALAGDSVLAGLGPLQPPDANGLRLPQGFSSRVVARTNQAPTGASPYIWHAAPDGGATFATQDGGWVYVSNSESRPGGVGALRFGADGQLVDAYGILRDQTILNCAGGPTPWGTWLSCEEHDMGRVWECDPEGIRAAVPWPALGVFKHEAVAVDDVNMQFYLTEDRPDGRFYRFTPTAILGNGIPNLSAGLLEAAEVIGPGPVGQVQWHPVPDPTAAATATRQQAPASTVFNGGEGVWYRDGHVYFTTKGDNRVWAYEIATAALTLIYDFATAATPILSGVDNITASPAGDLLVAEDGGDMEIVGIAPDGTVAPILQVVGHNNSEIAGPAFSPAGDRLYFSSQRGTGMPDLNPANWVGVTYEVTGQFFA